MDLLAPKKGETLLDLGCGQGNEIKKICQTASPKKIYGLDLSEKHLATAKINIRKHIVTGTAELMRSDASQSLPFPRNYFNAVYSLDLLECLGESQRTQLLSEIYRVLKPGGRIVIEHTDWDTQVWNSRHRDLERRLVHAFCDTKQHWMIHAEGWMGRKLWEWINQKRLFKKPRIETYVLSNTEYKPGLFGYGISFSLSETLNNKKFDITKKEIARFLGDLRSLAKARRYFYSVNRYVIMARK
jgi:ubiquinone/menaquinone biosynthesis C-methylase UbiE